jgi:hypothetical protein
LGSGAVVGGVELGGVAVLGGVDVGGTAVEPLGTVVDVVDVDDED